VTAALAGGIPRSPNDAFVIAGWRVPGGPAAAPRRIAPSHLHYHGNEACCGVGRDGCACRQVPMTWMPPPRTHTGPRSRSGVLPAVMTGNTIGWSRPSAPRQNVRPTLCGRFSPDTIRIGYLVDSANLVAGP